MSQPSSTRASHLTRMIRKIVKEELASIYKKKENPLSNLEAEHEADDLFTQFTAPRLAEDLDTGTWHIFGATEPLSSNRPEQARALPGFPELYHPDFSELESPPYLPKFPKHTKR
jgi:hypothetical protein